MDEVGNEQPDRTDAGRRCLVGFNARPKVKSPHNSTFGTWAVPTARYFISTFGESHGPSIGVVIDGCPAGLDIDETFIQAELQRRKPGQSHITTQRKEEDACTILSGVFDGKSTGHTIALIIHNRDQRSQTIATWKRLSGLRADYTISGQSMGCATTGVAAEVQRSELRHARGGGCHYQNITGRARCINRSICSEVGCCCSRILK